MCIDHHVSNDAFQRPITSPNASSTSELVYTLLDDEKISKACAEALYMGIAHDTGVFQYFVPRRKPVLEAAAQLLEKESMEVKSSKKPILRKLISKIRFLEEHFWKVCWFWKNKLWSLWYPEKRWNFFRRCQVIWKELWHSCVRPEAWRWRYSYMKLIHRNIKSVLRSKGKVNVSRIAQYFGGGGHVRAAGVRCQRLGT